MGGEKRGDEHLDESTIAMFVDGRLPEDSSTDVETHIDACESCRVLVGALARASDTLPATRDSMSLLEVGSTIGRYRVIERLGAGAMGVVWKALDPKLDRKIAIKVVHGNLARSTEASNRLLREARAMAKLSHRSVVTVHDAGDVDGKLFLAMELVPGTTLGQMLRTRTEEERRDWKKWLAMMIYAGRGLEAAHGAGVLHRDFKPENVLVDPSGRVCVADVGLATLGEDRVAAISERRSKAQVELTTTGALLGTPAYMSPQQLRGETIDARADQFAFCVATYEALFGQRPFPVEGQGFAMIAALEQSIESGVLRRRPDSMVPDEILDVLQRGLAARPEDRWPDMTALLAALERAARSGKRTTTNPSIAPAPKLTRRVIVLAAIGGALAATLVALGVRLLGADDKAAPPVAKKRADVSLKTEVAISPDGKRMVIGNDRIEVREIDGPRTWTMPLRLEDDLAAVQITDEYVQFSVRAQSPSQRWYYASDGRITTESNGNGIWYGATTIGEVFYRHAPTPTIVVLDGEREVRRWPATTIVETIAVSPDKKRVASLEADRYSGRVVIRDVTRDLVIQTGELTNPATVAWADERTLVYATGTGDQPRIYRARITGDKLGTPEVIYTRDYGWFGEIAIAKNRMLFVEMSPVSRARLVDGTVTRDLDNANVAVALGWLGETELLTWNRTNRKVERRSLDGKLLPSKTIELASEAANATIAGDIVIAAIRQAAGREVIAHSLSTGEKLWSHPIGASLGVRCANDRAPPCYAIIAVASNRDQLVPIDPQTGKTGAAIFDGTLEDVAVDATGDRLLVAARGQAVYEMTPDGKRQAVHETPLANTRSVAWIPAGGFMVGGTAVRNTFQVGKLVDGKYKTVAQAENNLLALVRPSHDATRVLMLARVYAPVLWEMMLP